MSNPKYLFQAMRAALRIAAIESFRGQRDFLGLTFRLLVSRVVQKAVDDDGSDGDGSETDDDRVRSPAICRVYCV